MKKFTEIDIMEDILENSLMGLWTFSVDLKNNIVKLFPDSMMLNLLGLKNMMDEALIYQHWKSRISAEYVDYVDHAVSQMIATKKFIEVQYLWNHPELGNIYVRCAGKNVLVDQNGIVYLKGYHQNINDLQRFKYKYEELELKNRLLKNQLNIDPLTGLLNRIFYEEEVAKYLSEHSKEKICFVMIDIDYFKLINDRHGHYVGDLVLQEFSTLLLKIFYDSEICCRMGGDEFSIFIPNYRSMKDIELKLEELCESIKHLEINQKYKFTPTISIGATFESVEKNDFKHFYQRADKMLYEMKKVGKNGIQIYQKSYLYQDLQNKILYYTQDDSALLSLKSFLQQPYEICTISDISLMKHSLEEDIKQYILIILEIDVLKEEGRQILEIIRDKNISEFVPIVLVFDKYECEAFKAAYTYGLNDFAAKPFNELLTLKVQNLLRHYQSRNKWQEITKN